MQDPKDLKTTRSGRIPKWRKKDPLTTVERVLATMSFVGKLKKHVICAETLVLPQENQVEEL